MIYLPALNAAPAARATAGTAAAANEPSRIASPARRLLYVDDDQSLGLLVKRMLERRGFQIAVYTDAIEAMSQIRRDPSAFDLIVSDYNMPEMSGLDVARAVRALRPDLPVVIVSGFIDEKLLAQARGAGVVELLVKASDPSDFCEALIRLGAAPLAE